MTCPPHHWLLDTPSPGITRVDARCKRCDATSDYRAFEDETARRTKNALVRPKRHDSYYRYPEKTPKPSRKAQSTMTDEEIAEWEAHMRRQAS